MEARVESAQPTEQPGCQLMEAMVDPEDPEETVMTPRRSMMAVRVEMQVLAELVGMAELVVLELSRPMAVMRDLEVMPDWLELGRRVRPVWMEQRRIAMA